MEILEKLLEHGATVDFQDRVSKRCLIGWEVGGGPNTSGPSLRPTWDTNRFPLGPAPTSSELYGLGPSSINLAWTRGFSCSARSTAQAQTCLAPSLSSFPGFLQPS